MKSKKFLKRVIDLFMINLLLAAMTYMVTGQKRRKIINHGVNLKPLPKTATFNILQLRL